VTLPPVKVSSARSSFLRYRWLEPLLFGLLTLAHLIPLWRFRYFSTNDGPAHLYNAWALKTLLFEPHSVLHHYLAINLNPEPNYLSHLLLMGGLAVGPPWLAEKLVLTLCVVSLPLAVRYLVASWQPKAAFLSILSFPFIYSVVFQFGFYNFCLSLALLLWVIGYWKRHVSIIKPRWQHVCGLTLGVSLLYAAHPLSYLVSGLILGVLALEQLYLSETAISSNPQPLRSLLRSLGILFLAYLPTLPLLGWYFWQKGTASSQAAGSISQTLWAWVTLDPIHIMQSAEGTYRRILAVVLFGLVLYSGWKHLQRRRVAPAWGWVVVSLLLVLAYINMPDSVAGGGVIRPRLGLLSYLCLFGLLATVPYSSSIKWGLVVIGSVLSLALISFRAGKYQSINAGVEEFCSVVAYMPRGATFLPLNFGHAQQMPDGKQYGTYIDVFTHAGGYPSVERQLISVENYEAQTGYFPLVWKPGCDVLPRDGQLPPTWSPTLVTPLARPDYVLVWASHDTPNPEPISAQTARRHLAQAYRLVYRSRTGLAELYQRRKY
jgi:hypothetical protein